MEYAGNIVECELRPCVRFGSVAALKTNTSPKSVIGGKADIRQVVRRHTKSPAHDRAFGFLVAGTGLVLSIKTFPRRKYLLLPAAAVEAAQISCLGESQH
jgi:hypothetical protein